MSKRITLDDDEIELLGHLLNHAMGQRSNFHQQLGDIADVTYQRLQTKLGLSQRLIRADSQAGGSQNATTEGIGKKQ